jgi:carbonic anhydrase/acetyltransferase-like protein (isoleucine patch superfamily)
MGVFALDDDVPRIHPTAFVHPDATIIGDVTIGAEATVWPRAVLRGDFGVIRVGARSSVQDGSVLHSGPDIPTIVEDDVVVGHGVHLEGCHAEPFSLIGSQATALHRTVVRTGAVVGAGALVPNDTEVPTGALALGVPCRIVADRADPAMIRTAVDSYVRNGRRYRAGLRLVEVEACWSDG